MAAGRTRLRGTSPPGTIGVVEKTTSDKFRPDTLPRGNGATHTREVTLELASDPPPNEVRIARCYYVAPCRARGCGRRGSFVARYLDSMGRFLRQFELCGAHADGLAARDKLRGIAVSDRRDS